MDNYHQKNDEKKPRLEVDKVIKYNDIIDLIDRNCSTFFNMYVKHIKFLDKIIFIQFINELSQTCQKFPT